jgi:hypothetical protein
MEGKGRPLDQSGIPGRTLVNLAWGRVALPLGKFVDLGNRRPGYGRGGAVRHGQLPPEVCAPTVTQHDDRHRVLLTLVYPG